MPTPNGGEEARTTTRGGDGSARRKKTGARKKKMERVKEMAACSFFLNLKQGHFCPFTLNAGCTLHHPKVSHMTSSRPNVVWASSFLKSKGDLCLSSCTLQNSPYTSYFPLIFSNVLN